jgi:hypothetical protein
LKGSPHKLKKFGTDIKPPVAGKWESLATFPFGLFAGIVLSTQFIGLYHCASKQHMATAISMYYMSQQIGIALGISIFSAFLKQEFKTTLQKTLIAVPNYQEVGLVTPSIMTNSLTCHGIYRLSRKY